MALNVITAKFCSGATQTWASDAWQYDYGQVLQFDGVDLPEAYQVHFSNEPMTGETITQIGNADGVSVPDQFFRNGEPIFAWVYLHEGEDDGETVYMVTIPVKKRPQPSDEVPTPEEQSAIDQAIAALNIAVEKADEAITHYPQIIDGTWHVWDVTTEAYVDTGVQAQGPQGVKGDKGDNGTSPTITVTDITDGHRVTITDADGTKTFDVMNGAQGDPGAKGDPGADGVSPTVTVTEITGGHRVVITDASGEHTFDVMDGQGGGGTITVDSAMSSTSENPVQNKVINAALGDLMEDLNQKVAKPTTSPNGTSGQLLRTNGDGTTEWVDQGLPTDEQTGQAVETWLDAHPEATTTVQDGAITLPKLNDSLADKIVITDETAKAYYHNASPSSVSFYPSSFTTDVSAKYSTSENLFEEIDFDVHTTSGITRSKNGRFISVEGTGTGGMQFFNSSKADVIEKLKGKTVNIYVYINKQNAWEIGSYFAIRANGSTTLARQNFDMNGGMRGWVAFENVQMPDDLTSIRLYFNTLNGATFVSGDFYFAVAYETQVVDTGHVVSGSEPYEYTVSGLNYIDTVMHESTTQMVVPTKEYVDSHIPDIVGFWSNSIYALPEHFGAIGDGVADDSNAIASCLEWAKQNGKAVKGYGTYKVSSPISIDGRYMDVYLKNIVYTGNQSAVMLKNMNIKFEFYSITSGNIGLNFAYNSEQVVKYARYCRVDGDAIESSGDCIYAEMGTLYNTVEVRKLESANGNCITFAQTSERDIFPAGEFVFRSSSCACRNGYVGSNINASKLYDFTIEGNCKYGLLNPMACVCVGFRHREQIDGYARKVNGGDANNGALIIFTKPPTTGKYGFKYITADGLYPWSIDVSAIQGYDDIGDVEKPTTVWLQMMFNGIYMDVPISKSGIISTIDEAYGVIGTKVCFIGNNKVFVPDGRKTVVISDPVYDYRVCEGQDDASIRAASIIGWGTDFIIDADTTIYFNASFGAIGYNDLTVTQRNGNTAIIYDKLGNVLFDGTEEGDGVWSLKCTMDRTSFGRLKRTTAWWGYDGTNEFWTIKKLETL